MQHKIGIIDLGSNTSRLIIMAYTPGVTFQLIDQLRERVRLSEGMGAENILRPEPMERTIRLLKVFRQLCEANGIDTIVATATSAARDARNQAEFLERVRTEAGLDLRILSGAEEAYYGYLGAVNSLPIQNGMVVDIGGGSLELARVQDRQLAQTASLPLGAVRLTETFIKNDPPKSLDLRVIDRYIDAMLGSIDWLKAGSGGMLVGLGGTARTLAKIDQERRHYPLDRLHGYTISLTSIENILHELEQLPLSKREKVPGLSADRADVIISGAIALTRLMHQGGYHEMTICGQGLREGLFYEQFLKDSGTALVPDVRAFGLANLTYLYNINWPHARHVQQLALSMFDQLRSLHGCGPLERAILSGAALLHDVGVAIDFYDHDQHSYYLILNAELPGFSHREVAMMALLAKYHRHGLPTVDTFHGLLTQADVDRVRKLSALLRLAEYLERGRTQVIQSITCRVRGKVVNLIAHTRGDATMEMWAANQNTDLFKQVFRHDLVIRLEPLTDRDLSSTPIEPAGSADAEPLWSRVRELIEQK
ncbi:MAG TPA: exopolyphosphatase [Anaerolineae bacterium]|nr:exopolyphosphatase [Anaerolineae bacterium]